MNRVLGNLILFILIVNFIVPIAYAQPSYKTAVIYYNEACSMCAMYVNQDLIDTLKQNGIKNIIKKDYVNEKQNRLELNKLNKEHNIPPTLQGHFMVFIDNKVILGGHVPKQIIADLLTKDLNFDKILVLQDEMGDAESYFVWAFKGDAKEYPIDTPITQYLDWFNQNKAKLNEPQISYDSSWSPGKMIPIVLSTGFLDGINPCALAVLLFFIAFLYTIKKTKTSIWKMGIAYIFAIFVAYFLIGLGLIKAIIFSGYPHFFASMGGYLMIVLGLLNIAGFILPKANFSLGIPSFSKAYLKKWMYKATVPAALVTGFLVGLCTFPCSGGMYVAVIGLLAAKTTYAKGLLYLVLYNIMFVMPLVIILVAASSRKVVDRIESWEKSQSKVLKLFLGLVMIALGLAILFWFI